MKREGIHVIFLGILCDIHRGRQKRTFHSKKKDTITKNSQHNSWVHRHKKKSNINENMRKVTA